MEKGGARKKVSMKAAGARVMTYRVESWSEFLEIIQSWQGFRNWCFRGQADARWSLQPSL